MCLIFISIGILALPRYGCGCFFCEGTFGGGAVLYCCCHLVFWVFLCCGAVLVVVFMVFFVGFFRFVCYVSVGF